MLTNEQLQARLGQEFHRVTKTLQVEADCDGAQIYRAGRRIRRRRLATTALAPIALLAGLSTVAATGSPGWLHTPSTATRSTGTNNGSGTSAGNTDRSGSWQLVHFTLGEDQAAIKVPAGTHTFDSTCEPSLLPDLHRGGTQPDGSGPCMVFTVYAGYTPTIPPGGHPVTFGGYHGTMIRLPNGHLDIYATGTPLQVAPKETPNDGRAGVAIGTRGLTERQVLQALSTFVQDFPHPQLLTATLGEADAATVG